MGDLEQLFQEQLMSLAEDIAEHQAARKGKAVVTNPSPQDDHTSIMVLEEDLAAVAPARLDELITLQPGGGSKWFVQHMPHSGSVASSRTQISRQPDIFPTSTLIKYAAKRTIQGIRTNLPSLLSFWLSC